MSNKQYHLRGDLTFEATSREDALNKVTTHLALLARIEGNQMQTTSAVPSWAKGELSLDESDLPQAAAGAPAGGNV
jgi:hypothetical protein